MSAHEVWSQLVDCGKDILSAGVDPATNVILCQTGNAVDSTADADASELYGPPGYYGIPANPTPGKPSCQPVTLKGSDRDMIIGTRDTRDSKIYGNLKPGERCIAAGFPAQGRILIKNNGAIVLYTTSDNTPGGTGVSLYVGPDKIQIANQYGQLTLGPDGVTLSMADGSSAVMLSEGKASLAGTQVTVNGSLVSVAGAAATCIGTGAAPSLATAALKGTSGPSATPCVTVFLGT